jgi:PPOX class probable F420-dependent enzyme
VATLTEEQRQFLLGEIKTGKLATVRADGRPHLVPVWYHLDGDTIVFNTGSKTVKAVNMRRDPRVCLCIDDEQPPFAYIRLEGVATLSDDLEEVKHAHWWALHGRGSG